MNKEKIRGFAIKTLQETNLENVENISISESTYADGSPYIEISIDYKGGEDK